MVTHSANGMSMSEIIVKIKKTPNPANDKEILKEVCEHLKMQKQDHTFFDARRWISNMSKSIENTIPVEHTFNLVTKYNSIKHISLKAYLKQKKIPISIADKYLTELKVFHPQFNKDQIALGFRHEKDGCVIDNQLLKGWTGEPAISFIRGKKPKPDEIHIYQNFWDYLSMLAHLNLDALLNDTMILNSFDCIEQVYPYIYQCGYQKAYTWLNNDSEGIKATRKLNVILQNCENLSHISMNQFYNPYTSFNEWYQKQNRI